MTTTEPTTEPTAEPGAATSKGPTPPSLMSRLAGPLFALTILAATVYALVAVLLDLPPGSWIIEREVRYSFDGRYGMVEAWAVTWFHLLLILLAPFGAAAFVASLTTARPYATLDPVAAERRRTLTRTRLIAGVLVSATAIAFYACLVSAPEALEPIGILARLGLVLGPGALVAGPTLLLDAVLAPVVAHVKVVRIDPVEHEPTKRRLNGIHVIDARFAESLHPGSEVSMIVTRTLGSVLSIAALDPYR